MPKVSIITINYGQEEVTLQLLMSLSKSIYQDFEVIVVDNNSPTGAPQQISFLYPEVRLVLSSENLGFAGGNNMGTQIALGEYLFYINNDAEVFPDTIEKLVAVLDLMPHVGGVSSKIKYFYKPNTLQYAGYYFAKYSKLESWFAIKDKSSTLYGLPLYYIQVRGGNQIDNGQFDEDADTPYLHGASMMVRRQAIEKAELMYEPYFLFYEELDWSTQLRKAGYTLRYVHTATVLHKVSVSTGKSSPLKTYLSNRNRGIFIHRNAPQRTKIISLGYYMCVDLPKNLLTHLLRGEVILSQSVLRAWWWNLVHLADDFSGTKLL